MSPPKDKAALRQELWAALKAAGAGRFPGIRGRIPNFVGAEAAARHLVAHPAFEAARVLKCNPDLPQRPVRHAALKAGKTVFLAVPKLAEDAPFLRLDPAELGPEDLWKASSIKGAFALGRPVAMDEVPPIDLIVTGCVGVGAGGGRLGKGGGYSDLEYALLRETGRVGPDTPIATTVHAVQRLAAGAIPLAPHDLSVDLVATADGVVEIDRTRPRPEGVDWSILPAEKVAAIPVLQAMRARARASRPEGTG